MVIIKKADRLKSTPKLLVAKMDGLKTKTLKKFYKKMADRLSFPEYFGYNLDALGDFLTDLTWLEEQNVILYIKNVDVFLCNENDEARKNIREIFIEATSNQIDEERTFEMIGVEA